MAIETFKKKSSNIADEGVSYNTETKQLTVAFKSFSKPPKISHYRYDNVPLEVWEELKKADSLGGFVNKHIVKGDYEYERVG